MSTATLHRLTADEYLSIERAAAYKSDFIDGDVIPMSGASEAHNIISGNLLAALAQRLKPRKYRVYPSDMKVRSPRGSYTYPDLTVAGDNAQFEDGRRDILLNPILIVEVLSPSTEANDRGRKFERYRSIDSLQTYVLVSQDHSAVEVYSRESSGRWSMAAFHEGAVVIPNPTCEISIAEIYDQVDFATAQVTPEETDA